jgi:hypothetical protein
MYKANKILAQQNTESGEPITWPNLSTDLSVLDYFFWSLLKEKVDEKRVHSSNNLINATKNPLRTSLANLRFSQDSKIFVA